MRKVTLRGGLELPDQDWMVIIFPSEWSGVVRLGVRHQVDFGLPVFRMEADGCGLFPRWRADEVSAIIREEGLGAALAQGLTLADAPDWRLPQ